METPASGQLPPPSQPSSSWNDEELQQFVKALHDEMVAQQFGTRPDRIFFYTCLDTSLGRLFLAYRGHHVHFLSREDEADFLDMAQCVCGVRPFPATEAPTKLLATLSVVIETSLHACASLKSITDDLLSPLLRADLWTLIEKKEDGEEEAGDES